MWSYRRFSSGVADRASVGDRLIDGLTTLGNESRFTLSVLVTMSEKHELVFEVIKELRLLISCQAKCNPTDEEWDQWLAAAGSLQREGKGFRLFVLTDGGHPTKYQIERLRKENQTNPRTSIISPSASVRLLAGALTFANPSIRCYAPSDLDRALEHVGLTRGDRQRVTEVIERLQVRLSTASAA
jgi:hypothetical protein